MRAFGLLTVMLLLTACADASAPDAAAPPVSRCTPPTEEQVIQFGLRGACGELRPAIQTAPPAGPRVVSLLGGVRALYSHIGNFSCAIVSATPPIADGLYCWGENQYGQLGDGTNVSRSTPAPVHFPPGYTFDIFARVALGAYHACITTGGGVIYCWGNNSFGQLGDGTTIDRSTPVRVSMPIDPPRSNLGQPALAAGAFHTCGTGSTNYLYCWGVNNYGQLGDQTAIDRHTPVRVADAFTVTNVAASVFSTCAIEYTTGVYCWGSNANGELGIGSRAHQAQPVWQHRGANRVYGGGFHFCSDGPDQTYGPDQLCWGYNYYGQLGTGDFVTREVPTPVVRRAPGASSDMTLQNVGLGMYTSCSGASGGGLGPLTVVCWGSNYDGELGDVNAGPYRPWPAPTNPPLNNLAQVIPVVGASHACAYFTNSRQVYCWGDNRYGQTGNP